MKIIIDILRCWIHGFKTKTGREPWLLKNYKKERMNNLVRILKNEYGNNIT